MEVIFKNRPYPNVEINEIENGESLEVVHIIDYGKDGIRKPTLILNKKSLSAFSEWLKFAMHSYSTKKAETPHDTFEGKIAGSDFREEDEIAIQSRHIKKDGTSVFNWYQHSTGGGRPFIKSC